MVDLMAATRAYEANVTALNIAKSMALKAWRLVNNMKKRREEGGGQEWLNTYADMITLVLTFFVLLYSISNVNISKLEEIAAAMQRQLGIETTSDLEDVPQDLKYPSISEGANAPEGEGSQFNTGSGAGSQSASSLAMAIWRGHPVVFPGGESGCRCLRQRERGLHTV